jgi:hypothetical protein
MKMNRSLMILALTAFLATWAPNAHALSAVAQQIEGEVLVQKAGSQDWTAVTADTPLESGDSIRTRQGSCALIYGDEAAFTVDPNTTLTVEERSDAQDLKLMLGKIKGKVNKQNAQQPFVVTTPAAVATVRGTDVDFGFNEEGLLTVDLHNGQIQVVNDAAEMQLDLGGDKLVTIQYDKEANVLQITNDPSSDGPIEYSILGQTYTLQPGEQKEADLSTSELGTQMPDLLNDDPETTENLDEGKEPEPVIEQAREPMSEFEE